MTKHDDTLRLVEALLDGGEFYGLSVTCPDCRNIEDEQYCCTTCWREPNTAIPVRELVEELLKIAKEKS